MSKIEVGQTVWYPWCTQIDRPPVLLKGIVEKIDDDEECLVRWDIANNAHWREKYKCENLYTSRAVAIAEMRATSDRELGYMISKYEGQHDRFNSELDALEREGEG